MWTARTEIEARWSYVQSYDMGWIYKPEDPESMFEYEAEWFYDYERDEFASRIYQL